MYHHCKLLYNYRYMIHSFVSCISTELFLYYTFQAINTAFDQRIYNDNY